MGACVGRLAADGGKASTSASPTSKGNPHHHHNFSSKDAANGAAKGADVGVAVDGPSVKQQQQASFEASRPNSNGDSRHARAASVCSEIEWHECREEFSISDGGPSPTADTSGNNARKSGDVHANGASAAGRAGSLGQEFDETVLTGGSETSDEPTLPEKIGCMSIIDVVLRPSQPEQLTLGPSGRVRSGRRMPHTAKLHAGCSLSARDMGMDWRDVRESYEDCDCTTFKIRGLDYMKTSKKVFSEQSFYRLAAADMFSTDAKELHLAKRLGQLPAAPDHHVRAGLNIPPLIILNLLLPTYAPSFFGGTDGPGHSIVYYFVLREEFDPATANPKALGLLQRFVANGREADGTPTRDRLKLLPRVVNVEEWSEKGPLSMSEHKLLINYNEKPILTRPQQHFFTGPNYLEVDLDIHIYTFLARKALQSFFSRLREVVWENAFVIQGNSTDELPEVVLGAARLYRTDFEVRRLFSDYVTKQPSASSPPETSPRQTQEEQQHQQQKLLQDDTSDPSRTDSATQ